jgi:hypothetical protein
MLEYINKKNLATRSKLYLKQSAFEPQKEPSYQNVGQSLAGFEAMCPFLCRIFCTQNALHHKFSRLGEDIEENDRNLCTGNTHLVHTRKL